MGVVVEARPLKKVEIARAMGWSKAYLSQGRFKGMPAFYRIEDFRAWYQATSQRGGPDGTVQLAGARNRAGAGSGSEEGKVWVNWAAYETPPERQNEETIRRCERAADLAYGLLDSAVKAGDIAAAYGSLKNWAETLKQAAAVKGEYLEILEKEGLLLSLDDVMNVVGGVLGALRNELQRRNAAIAHRISPGDPRAALEILNEDLDDTLKSIENARERISAVIGKGGSSDKHVASA